MIPKENEISNLIQSINSIVDDASNFGNDLKHAREGIGKLQNTLVQLDDYAKRIQNNVTRAVEKLQTLKGFSNSIEMPKDTPKAKLTNKTDVSEQKNMVDKKSISADEKKSSSRTDSTTPVGIMIFICPEGEGSDHQIGDSTCIPRRQLVPTTQEEKMILDYLIQKGHKPNQREYNRVYRELSTMLVKAPKNAVAIELRVGKPEEELKTVELFFHVKVKDTIQFADFRYVRYKGVDAYRIKSAVTV